MCQSENFNRSPLLNSERGWVESSIRLTSSCLRYSKMRGFNRCLLISLTIVQSTLIYMKRRDQALETKSTWQIWISTQENRSLPAWKLFSLLSETSTISSISEDCNLGSSLRDWTSPWTRHTRFGSRNLRRRLTQINLRDSMATTSGICSARRAKSRTISHGPATKFSIRLLQGRTSFMDAPSRPSLRITLSSSWVPTVLKMKRWGW